MLEEISIAKVATYPNEAETLTGLRSVNFIFGTNGAGKTTISRVIADAATHPDCRLTWSGDRPIDALVYNRDFIDRNFTPQMPGIFTLGHAEADTLGKIEEGRAASDALMIEIAGMQKNLGIDDSSGYRLDLKTLRDQFVETCWKLKVAHDDHFQGAFEGLRNSKTKFCDRILEECVGNEAKAQPFDELKGRAATVYAENVTALALLSSVDGQALLEAERHAVLSKKVVGKEDVDVAGLIRRLGNSDWVRQGLAFAEAGAPCPFCQKGMEADLLNKLNAFFDEVYIADLTAIDNLRDTYAVNSVRVLDAADAAITSGSVYIDTIACRPLVERLRTAVALNKTKLDRKRAEPSGPVKLEPLEEALNAVTDAIEQANSEITRHNNLVANLKNERRRLSTEIWKHLVDDRKDVIGAYHIEKNKLEKTVAGITAAIQKKTENLAATSANLAELERQVTSVQPVVTEINATLASFGFASFKLETAGDKNEAYRIVRGDGTDARETLSEGERSFISFLYFYHLIRGSTTASGVTSNRIVVFDDPVSSLDSDVLFIVSALIKRVLIQAQVGSGQVKQAFVLTHNIYFHKEVSFDPKRSGSDRRHFETFWTVRKIEKVSRIQGHATNPVQTSYELLWAEVKNPERSTLTIQNVLRRILEHYFKILGGMDRDDVISKFEGKDALICASLFSWVNDGSHNFADDLYVTSDAATVERYLAVFKAIFDRTDHGAHYRMMFGPESQPSPPLASAAEPASEAPPEVPGDAVPAALASVLAEALIEPTWEISGESAGS